MRVLYVIRILNSKISLDLFTFPLLVLLVLWKFSQVKLAPSMLIIVIRKFILLTLWDFVRLFGCCVQEDSFSFWYIWFWFLYLLEMADQDIARLRGIRNVYLRLNKNSEREIVAQLAWDVSERSQSDVHWERHLREFSETSQKRRLFLDVFKTSQIHLKKDVFFVTSIRRLRNISKKTSFVWRL